MHQTFYIDLEEEISSVIDRLNKSMATDNYFVVPRRAIFLQSIVNLKLLKREADKVGKNVIIVTQDEIGASMAQRCGIDVRATLDGLEAILNAEDDVEDMEDKIQYEKPKIEVPVQQKKQVRLSGVGSSEFYDTQSNTSSEDFQKSVPIKSQSKKLPVNSIYGQRVNVQASQGKISQQPNVNSVHPKISVVQKPQAVGISGYKNGLDFGKEKALEKIYSNKDNINIESAKPSPKSDGRVKKIFIGFIVLCLFAFTGVALYLFFPSAKVSIEPNILNDKINLDLHGGSDIVQADQLDIPLKAVNINEDVTLSYDVKGGATVTGKKAHGSVVIYNEFDNSSQTLVATTRLSTADGKIFRLSKNVVVPGMTTVAGEVKPGAITADVIADQPGADYNIDPTDFNIPGFKDGPKFNKFYAKSTTAMAGGSTEGETAGGAVMQSDIDNAKQKTEATLKDKLSQSVNDGLQKGEIALEQAEKITIIKSSAAAKTGDITSAFNYTATGSVQALVFSENDVMKIMEQSLKNEQQSQDVRKVITKIDYGSLNPDFDKNTLDMQTYGEVTITPIINTDQIKQELLGKTDNQLADILKKYSSIKNVNVEFQPSFVSRIPQYPQRVSIEIKTGSN